MAEAVITILARKKMLQARAGAAALPKITGMAFGTGGVDVAGTVIVPTAEQTSLNAEQMRKVIDGYEFLSETSCRYSCTLAANEMVGKNISEIALYDEEGDLVAIKNFSAKGKDDDLEMTFNVDDKF